MVPDSKTYSHARQEFKGDAPVVTCWLDVVAVSPDGTSRGIRKTDGVSVQAQTGADSRNTSESLASHPPSIARENTTSSTKNRLTLQASHESEDRAGDVIRAEGWELDNYRLNPVVLWAHRHDLLPVGKSVDVWVESGALMATIEFAPTDFAQ